MFHLQSKRNCYPVEKLNSQSCIGHES